MSPRQRPTLRSRWLGRELEALRKSTGRKMADVARHLGRDASGVSRFESGTGALPHDEVVSMFDLYEEPPGPRRDALVQLSHEEWSTDWWDAYAQEVDGSLLDAIWLESKAVRIDAFDLTFVNGLLQTPDYIRALARAALPGSDTRGVDRLVEMRLSRQTILERSTPPTLTIVVDEAALRRAVGGPAALAQQVRRLADAGSSHAQIEVQALPFAVGAHAGPDCAFRILELPQPFPEVVLLDRPYGMVVVEPPDSGHFASVYAGLKRAALGPDESVELLNDIAAQLEQP